MHLGMFVGRGRRASEQKVIQRSIRQGSHQGIRLPKDMQQDKRTGTGK